MLFSFTRPHTNDSSYLCWSVLDLSCQQYSRMHFSQPGRTSDIAEQVRLAWMTKEIFASSVSAVGWRVSRLRRTNTAVISKMQITHVFLWLQLILPMPKVRINPIMLYHGSDRAWGCAATVQCKWLSTGTTVHNPCSISKTPLSTSSNSGIPLGTLKEHTLSLCVHSRQLGAC